MINANSTSTPFGYGGGDPNSGIPGIQDANEEYGVDILRVQEIRSYEKPTTIANAPDTSRAWSTCAASSFIMTCASLGVGEVHTPPHRGDRAQHGNRVSGGGGGVSACSRWSHRSARARRTPTSIPSTFWPLAR